MDKFIPDFLTGFTACAAWAAVAGILVMLRKALVRLMAKPARDLVAGGALVLRKVIDRSRVRSTSGDLVPGAMSGSSLTASMATGNVTPQYRAPPNLGQFLTEHDQWYSAVQGINRFERGKMAGLLAGSEYQGSPRVLLDHPPRM